MPPAKPRRRYPKLIGYSHIVEISGRKRQTVYTWRMGVAEGTPRVVRYEPPAVPNSPPSPLFDRGEVVAWLKQTLRLTPDGRPQFRNPARNGKTRTI